MDNMQDKNIGKIAGQLPVLFALFANILITLIKFYGYWLSHSPSLFAEAVHSFADTANQTLLLFGIRRSLKKPNDEFPYGFGQERFFWNTISATGIFFLGCGANIYHGIDALVHGVRAEIDATTALILGISLLMESLSMAIALREKRKGQGDDTSTLAVVLEDGAAILGLLVAAAAIAASHFTGKLFWDALGSILVGILLGAVAIVLIKENKGLLIEKSMPEEIRDKVIAIIRRDPVVEKIIDFKSSTTGVNTYRVKCEIEIHGHMLLGNVPVKFLAEEYESIKDFPGFMRFCSDSFDRVPRLIGSWVDKIEEEIISGCPEVVHIDIEIN